MVCREFAEERYWESSIVIGLEMAGSSRYWVSFSYEPGRRDYIVDENEIYSDFYFNRLMLMASLEAPRDFTLSLFVMHDPERHSRRYDDFSLTMVSASISKGF